MKLQNYLMVFILLTLSADIILRAQSQSEGKETIAVEEIVTGIYDLVSFNKGETPDWEKVKSLFIADAVIVLRSSFTNFHILTREGFVEDFQNFIADKHVDETGFLEQVISIKTKTVGDIAHCIVVYEASFPNQKKPAQRGLDSFQLIRIDGGWLIVSIVNEIQTSERPFPQELLN